MSYLYLRYVDPNSKADIDVLFKLLAERTPAQSISHTKMPTYGQHSRFVKSNPYKAWYLIGVDEGNGPAIAGSTYLTEDNELGIFIFRNYHGKGYASRALEDIMTRYDGPFLANINPSNEASKKLFEKLGFKFIQVTYAK